MVEVHVKSELLVYSSPLMLLVMKGNCGAIFYCIDQRTRTIIEPVINLITSDLAAMLHLNNMIDTKFKITIGKKYVSQISDLQCMCVALI